MMRPRQLLALCACMLGTSALAAPPRAIVPGHQFGVIGHSFAYGGDEGTLRQALADTSDPNLAFVVATGIKGTDEACSDALYGARRELLADSARPLILVPAASDWSSCLTPNGRSAAVERLARLRDVFFDEPGSLGQHKLALTRLSSTAKFRSFAEYAQWEVGKVVYATMNLTSDNNHFRPEAGRNSEFEDRLVANRAWLHRLATGAQRKKMEAIVLFSEGSVNAGAAHGAVRQDGFADARRQLTAIALKFPGKVLLIDSALPANGAAPAIRWMGNLGQLSVGGNAVEVRVTPGGATLFAVGPAAEHN